MEKASTCERKYVLKIEKNQNKIKTTSFGRDTSWRRVSYFDRFWPSHRSGWGFVGSAFDKTIIEVGDLSNIAINFPRGR